MLSFLSSFLSSRCHITSDTGYFSLLFINSLTPIFVYIYSLANPSTLKSTINKKKNADHDAGKGRLRQRGPAFLSPLIKPSPRREEREIQVGGRDEGMPAGPSRLGVENELHHITGGLEGQKEGPDSSLKSFRHRSELNYCLFFTFRCASGVPLGFLATSSRVSGRIKLNGPVRESQCGANL